MKNDQMISFLFSCVNNGLEKIPYTFCMCVINVFLEPEDLSSAFIVLGFFQLYNGTKTQVKLQSCLLVIKLSFCIVAD